MQTIIFIGSNKSGTSREALQTSKQMGYFTVLFTDRQKFIKQQKEFPEVDQMVFIENLFQQEKLLYEISLLQQLGKEIKACLSFIDPFVSYAGKIAGVLGLFQCSPDAMGLMEDKLKVRETLRDLSITPYYAVYHDHSIGNDFIEQNEKYLPLILKPTMSNGSKNIILAKSKMNLIAGINSLKRKNINGSILVEEYLEGPQYLIEVLIYNNEIQIVAVIEQEINDRFIVTGYSFPAEIDESDQLKLEESVAGIVKRVGITNGICHLEVRKVKGEWKLIEINPRMSGGAMNRILEEGTRINLVKEIIKLHLGEQPDLKTGQPLHVHAKYLTVNSQGRLLKVTGKNRASAHQGVKYVYVKPVKGSILIPPISMGNRYACVVAAAEKAKDAKKVAIAAAKEIKFFLEPL
ncbi:MAG: ATP-grasp domain-containing protein [Bacillota bacterium]